MRFATLLASLLLLAVVPRAQTAADFYPLDVGNEWVYRIDDGGETYIQRDRVVGIVDQGGQSYAQRERCDFPLGEEGVGMPECTMGLVRITADGDVVVRQSDGSERQEACGLGQPFGAVVPCDDVTGGGDAALEVIRDTDRTVRVGDYEVASRTVQDFEPVNISIDPPPPSYAVGIGRLAVLAFGTYAERFEYARVGDPGQPGQAAEYGLNPLDPDPASFDPLAVGTVREYIRPISDVGGPPVREDDVRTLVLDGETWTLRRTQERSLGSADLYTRSEARQLLRYDDATANVLTRRADGSVEVVYPCGLDAPVGESDCGGLPVTKTLVSSVDVGGERRQTATLGFSSFGPSPTLAAGLGLVYTFGEASPDTRVRYVDVGPLASGDPLPLGTPFGALFPTEPDPTPGHLYYPLSIGDEWHEEYGEIGVPQFYRQRLVTGTEQIGGETFFVVETASAEPGDAAWTPAGSFTVRYDSLSGHVVYPNGSTRTVCPLDEPVNLGQPGDTAILCSSSAPDADGYAAYVTLPPTNPRAVKFFDYRGIADGVDPEIYEAGIGFIPNRFGAFTGNPYARLAYARVRQDDGSILMVGEVVVAGEDDAPTATLALTASPNPTAGALRLAIDLPTAGPMTVEAFDALGRRVYSGTRDAVGALTLSLDASGWAPGAYVVRVRTADGVATARVVRR